MSKIRKFFFIDCVTKIFLLKTVRMKFIDIKTTSNYVDKSSEVCNDLVMAMVVEVVMDSDKENC